MRKLKIGTALVALALAVAACGDDASPVSPDESGGEGLALRLLSKKVREPANVTLAFQVKTAAGEPVTQLPDVAFRVLEDGEPVSAFESTPRVLPRPGRFVARTVLLLDLSGSILASSSLPVLKDAARSFVTAIVPPTATPTSEVGIWWFDGESNLHALVPFTTSRATLLAAIDKINAEMSRDNSTNLNGAVIAGIDIAATAAIQDLQRDLISSNSVVVFTDGTDRAARRTMQEVQASVTRNRESVSLYTIGLGGETNEANLKAIGFSGYFPARSVSELVDAFTGTAGRIGDEANSFYVLEYCSPKRAGTHTVRLETNFGPQTGWVSTTFSASGFRGGCKVAA